MKKISVITFLICILSIIAFSASTKIAAMGGVGMLFPEQGVSLNFNPAAAQVMNTVTLSMNTGNKGKDRYFVQLEIPAKMSTRSSLDLSFQVNDSFKKFALAGAISFFNIFDFGISYNYLDYMGTFRGTGFNLGIGKKYKRIYWGIALINAGDTYLNPYNEELYIKDYKVYTSTPLSPNNYWGMLDPMQGYVIYQSTHPGQYKLPEMLNFTYTFTIDPNFVFAVDIREHTNNFKDLKITSDSVIYAFEQNFQDASAIRGAYSKKFWALGVGFTRFGIETNYAFIKSKDKIKKHYVSLTFSL